MQLLKQHFQMDQTAPQIFNVNQTGVATTSVPELIDVEMEVVHLIMVRRVNTVINVPMGMKQSMEEPNAIRLQLIQHQLLHLLLHL